MCIEYCIIVCKYGRFVWFTCDTDYGESSSMYNVFRMKVRARTHSSYHNRRPATRQCVHTASHSVRAHKHTSNPSGPGPTDCGFQKSPFSFSLYKCSFIIGHGRLCLKSIPPLDFDVREESVRGLDVYVVSLICVAAMDDFKKFIWNIKCHYFPL